MYWFNEEKLRSDLGIHHFNRHFFLNEFQKDSNLVNVRDNMLVMYLSSEGEAEFTRLQHLQTKEFVSFRHSLFRLLWKEIDRLIEQENQRKQGDDA